MQGLGLQTYQSWYFVVLSNLQRETEPAPSGQQQEDDLLSDPGNPPGLFAFRYRSRMRELICLTTYKAEARDAVQPKSRWVYNRMVIQHQSHQDGTLHDIN